MSRATPSSLAALVATALVLAATSRAPPTCPPESGLVSGPIAFAVDTTCGAPATVVTTVDPGTCRFTLDGADGVGFGAAGSVRDDGRTLELYGEGPRDDCEADLTGPGEYAIRCYADLPQGGCEGGSIPVCGGTLRLVPPP